MFEVTTTLRALRYDAFREILLFLPLDDIRVVGRSCREAAAIAFSATTWEFLFYRDAPMWMQSVVRHHLLTEQRREVRVSPSAFLHRSTELLVAATVDDGNRRATRLAELLCERQVRSNPALQCEGNGGPDDDCVELPWTDLYDNAREINTPGLVAVIHSCEALYRDDVSSRFVSAAASGFRSYVTTLQSLASLSSTSTLEAQCFVSPVWRGRWLYWTRFAPAVVHGAVACGERAADRMSVLGLVVLCGWGGVVSLPLYQRAVLGFSLGHLSLRRFGVWRRPLEVLFSVVPLASRFLTDGHRERQAAERWIEARSFSPGCSDPPALGTWSTFTVGGLVGALLLRGVGELFVLCPLRTGGRERAQGRTDSVRETTSHRNARLTFVRRLLCRVAFCAVATSDLVPVALKVHSFLPGAIFGRWFGGARSPSVAHTRATAFYTLLLDSSEWLVGRSTGLAKQFAEPSFVDEKRRGDKTFLLGIALASVGFATIGGAGRVVAFVGSCVAPLGPFAARAHAVMIDPTEGAPDEFTPFSQEVACGQARWRSWRRRLVARVFVSAALRVVEDVLLAACGARIRIGSGSAGAAITWRIGAVVAVELFSVGVRSWLNVAHLE